MQRGIFYAGLAGALWGFVFVVPSLLPDFNPLLLSTGRYIVYGILSALIILPKLIPLIQRLTRLDIQQLIWLSLSGNLVYYLLLASAVQLAGVATTSLIIGTLPVTITLAGRKDQGALSLRQLAWPLLLIMLGMLAVNISAFQQAANQQQPLHNTVLGILCAFGALFSWTRFAVNNTRYLKLSQFTSSEWSSLWGITTGLLSVLLLLIAGGLFPSQLLPELPQSRWLSFFAISLGLALFSSWLGNLLWNAASRRLPITLGGQLIIFETLFALLYGFVYAARWPSLTEIIAIALLISGVLWTVRKHR
ncbi:multidrug DMT transporter permease [Thiopseudomonas alkaliphila]|uniref:DMT family transporter n=1 Tax=Thiopseudomonas alkaliphila TaxID=1697053 RepID=UPI00069D7446|nr:DMT family transporter [Thiopseudomonas alkaliphila]AKX44551.1 multidrug DMT transporter permease [Thiopseudomonas alkaliphila]AKX46737.1 multidrug DMT transporter permease [Thiopseudomonas alkaliphila]AKX49841.1 multidrug DMT transporter permease [Thiopseudomonas alkaliphila]AKX52272.1 multidrug DMT transporter permease [Thiopseudomonas alkaliphila]